MPRLALLPLLLIASTCSAAGPLTALDAGSVSAGVYFSDVGLTGAVSAEDEFDGEVHSFADDFDLGHRRRVEMLEVSWAPWRRHEFRVGYHRDVRRRTLQLSEEFEFEGETFPVDVDLRSELRFSALSVDYTYWWYAEERTAFGLQVGAERLSAGLALRGRVASEGNGEVTIDAAVSDHLYAPTFGVAARQVFGDRWRGSIELRAMELSHRSYDGRALAGTIGLEYFATERLGLVLQYSDSRVRVSRSAGIFDGEVELRLSGPQAMLRYRF